MALHEDDCNNNKTWPLDKTIKKKINQKYESEWIFSL